jgi:uncharacterized protein YigE (DUF2233 family)
MGAAGRIVKRSKHTKEENRACYSETKEGPMKVEKLSINPRSQIQNIVTYYTYTAGTGMRKIGNAHCDNIFER